MKILSRAGVFVISIFLLVACSSSDDGSDLADAMTFSEDEANTLADFFNGTSDEKAARAADVATANTQTLLRVGILVAVIVLIVVVVLKKRKK